MCYLATMMKMPNDKALILDPYCGSGTTIMACRTVGVKAVGFELNEKYAAIASARSGLELTGELAKWRTMREDKQLKLF
jgi:DNA modification methylase